MRLIQKTMQFIHLPSVTLRKKFLLLAVESILTPEESFGAGTH